MRYSLALLAVAAAAVEASPFPQAVTALISPTASAPSGCLPTFTGSFGIVNVNVSSPSTSSVAKRQATQLSDGQPQAASTVTGAITAISDGQPQATSAAKTVTGAVSVISDGQPQATPSAMTVAMVSMIGDGQVQGDFHTQMMMAVTQIGDGQVQGNTVVMMPVTAISDGQPQAPQAPTATATAVSQISDAQPQAASATVTGASQISDAQPQASSATASSSGALSTSVAFCQSNDTLTLTLNNGVLKDGKGRTGYIASNYQFQFDSPPQAGSIYTSGFSVCGNGTLALGGSNIFYQCRSGNFYNLYDRHWAPQCNAIYIQTGAFVDCS